MTPITVARRPSRQSGVMPEIVLPNTWRDESIRFWDAGAISCCSSR